MEKEQLRLEQEMKDQGVARYQTQKNRGVEHAPAEQKLIHQYVDSVAQGLAKWCETKTGSQAGQYILAQNFLSGHDPHVAAYLGIVGCFRAAVNQNPITIQKTAIQIADALINETGFNEYLNQVAGDKPKSYRQKVLESINRRTNPNFRSGVLAGRRRSMDMPGTVKLSGEAEMCAVGMRLISLCILHTPLFEILQFRPKNQNRGMSKTLRLSEEAQQWMERADSVFEHLSPVLTPMVIPPKEWTSPVSGGYLSIEQKLMKNRCPEQMAALEAAEIDPLYRGINYLQNVPYAINKRVLEVMRELNGTGLAGLPHAELDATLPEPFTGVSEGPDGQYTPEFVLWKKQRQEAYTEWFNSKSLRSSTLMKIRLAEKLSGYERIYFPWSLDWRDRLYPMPNYIHPQAEDAGKALLHFADGKPLGEEGAYWLAIHGANEFDIPSPVEGQKPSFSELYQWVLDHEREIRESAENPVDGTRWWTEAEKPFMFLAFCFEWRDYLDNGITMPTRIPVGMDGSCNGPQHFAALLRDEVGGKAVNLLPGARPNDAYMDVVKVVVPLVDTDTVNPDFADLWRGRITRPIVKRNVMTLTYGATVSGFRSQLADAIKKVEKKTGQPFFGEGEHNTGQLCHYLARKNDKAIRSVMVKACEGMDFLRDCAQVVSEHGYNDYIQWTTPLGVPLIQRYMKTKSKKVETYHGPLHFQLAIQEELPKVNVTGNRNGFAPNFIHSMDATHLLLTLLEAEKEGLTGFAAVHDSFGTHACDIPVLNRIIRETFVKMYSSGNILSDLLEELKTQVPAECHNLFPAVPEMGSLDLNKVLDSPYFFS